MRKLVFALALIFGSHNAAIAQKTPVGITYDTQIVRVTDGDTVVIAAPFLPSPLKPELAVRVFTGSRDVPKDNQKAVSLFQFSETNSHTPQEHNHVQYYQLLLRKFKIH